MTESPYHARSALATPLQKHAAIYVKFDTESSETVFAAHLNESSTLRFNVRNVSCKYSQRVKSMIARYLVLLVTSSSSSSLADRPC